MKDEMESAKSKLEWYKKQLESIRSGHVLEDYLSTKKQNEIYTSQVNELVEEMKQLKGNLQELYLVQQQQLESVVSEIVEWKTTMKGSQQKILQFVKEVNGVEWEKLNENMKTLIDQQMNKQVAEHSLETESLKEEISHLKKKLSENPPEINQKTKNNSQPSSFRQLQNLLSSSSNVVNETSTQQKPSTINGTLGLSSTSVPTFNQGKRQPKPMGSNSMNQQGRSSHPQIRNEETVHQQKKKINSSKNGAQTLVPLTKTNQSSSTIIKNEFDNKSTSSKEASSPIDNVIKEYIECFHQNKGILQRVPTYSELDLQTYLNQQKMHQQDNDVTNGSIKKSVYSLFKNYINP
ncbi:hypothetical protein [Bacillus sp. 2205SS5-2]|uniref:hypothetical protein n=1 Tax=Bacillus sp. 2205SS5-2 TaxID=3109031 RepID=UPI003005AF70